MDPQTQQPVTPQVATPSNDSFVDPTQRKPGFSIKGIIKNKLALLGIVFIIILVVIAGLWLMNSQKQKTYEAVLKNATEAREAYKNGDIKTVQDKLIASYKLTPKDPKVQAALINAIAAEGNLTGTEQEAFKKGEPYVKEALSTNRNSVDVLLAVGYLNEIAGNYDSALGFYEEALNINGDNAEGWFHKGHVLEFLGRQTDAYTAYKKAYSIDQNNALVLTGAARAMLAEGKTNDAQVLYVKAGDMIDAPFDVRADAYTNASFIKRSQILYMQDAIDLSEKAVKIAPNYSPALAMHGFNLGINGRFTEGVGYMQKSLIANPRIALNYYYLGLLYRTIKDYASSIKYQEEGFAKIDNDNTILDASLKKRVKGNMAYDLARTYSLSSTNAEKIVSLLQQSVELNPNLKPAIKNDIDSGTVFTESASNPILQALIQ